MPLLIYSEQLEFLQCASWFRGVVEKADVRLTTNSTLTLVTAACEGLGVAPMSCFIGERAGLVRINERAITQHDLWLVSHPEFRREPRVRAVAEFLKEICTGTPGSLSSERYAAQGLSAPTW